ncbi:MAG: Gfo/Idh/MocA family protein [Candidatus Thorarchaeota archaeon]
MNPMRGAVIGGGTIAKLSHLPALASLKGVEIDYVVDTNLKRAKSIARKFKVKNAESDYKAILEKNLDFVCITTPPFYHKEIAVDFLKAGIPVLIEKPIATKESDAKEILTTAARKSVICGVVHNRRFYSTIQRAKKTIGDGRLGDIYHADFNSFVTGPSIGYPATDWHFNPEVSGGGVSMDQGIHTLDLIRWILGEITSIYSIDTTIFKSTNNTDTSSLSIVTCATTRVSMELSWISDYTACPITLRGSAGVIYIEPMLGYYEEVHEPRNPAKRWLNFTRTVTRFAASFGFNNLENTHKMLIGNFLLCLKEGRTPLVTGQDGYLALRDVATMYESMRENKEIKSVSSDEN